MSEPERESRSYWAKRLGLRLLVLVIGMTAVSLAGMYMRSRQPLPHLAVYGRLPTFQLVDQTGAPFTDGSMAGHVSVVDFIFTRCAASCPRLTARMAELQGRLTHEGSKAKLVSFSVDPENDTPSVLTEYAAKAGAEPARWSFVTGPVDTMKSAVVSGFKVAVEKLPKGANDYDVTHGDWFVLVDATGKLRGYYTTDDAKDYERLVRDIGRLEHPVEGKEPPRRQDLTIGLILGASSLLRWLRLGQGKRAVRGHEQSHRPGGPVLLADPAAQLRDQVVASAIETVSAGGWLCARACLFRRGSAWRTAISSDAKERAESGGRSGPVVRASFRRLDAGPSVAARIVAHLINEGSSAAARLATGLALLPGARETPRCATERDRPRQCTGHC